MAKYLLVYSDTAFTPEGEEARRAAMEQWTSWLDSLGEAVVDGGSPFGGAATLRGTDSSDEGGKSGLTGYSVLAAESVTDASEKARGCPVLSGGGTVEVYEIVPIG